MRKSILTKLLFAVIAATQLSGCIVVPWHGDGDEGLRHGEYHEHHEGHYGDHGEHY